MEIRCNDVLLLLHITGLIPFTTFKTRYLDSSK